MPEQDHSPRMAVLLMTDIVESVALQDRVGTQAYARLIELHHQLFQDVLRRFTGSLLHEDKGDGFFAEFRTSADSVNAALLFQMLLRQAKWEGEQPFVRIGIHQGQLEELGLRQTRAGKLVGMPVNIAARVMDLAIGRQILMTRAVYDDARQFVRDHPVVRPDAPSRPEVKWKPHGKYHLKGLTDSVEVFEVGAAGIAPFTLPPDTDKARIVASDSRRPSARSRPVIGAVLTALCGLVLWQMPLGDPWVNASYDYQFRFCSRPVTTNHNLVLVLMDNAAHYELKQEFGKPWDRALHAELLKKLKEDGCPLVVFDVIFDEAGEQAEDKLLAEAMQNHGRVVLGMASIGSKYEGLEKFQALPLYELFQNVAAGTGVAKTDASSNFETARKHWPFSTPNDTTSHSLSWAAAKLAGAQLTTHGEERWLRYYGERGAWDSIPYQEALSNLHGYFDGKIVFIGRDPQQKNAPDVTEDRCDKFRSPYTRWNSESVAGVEIMAATFLNLMNSDWLQRPAWPVEGLSLITVGVLLGGSLPRFRRGTAIGIGVGAALLFGVTGVCLIYFTNYWFPWLIIVGGQVPCALAWAVLVPARLPERRQAEEKKPTPTKTMLLSFPEEALPDAPEYEVITPEIGKGGFGKVWIVRNAIGQWQALKAVYESNFGGNRGPYEAEFKGLQRYKPVSEKHPGLLRIDLVSKMKEAGYFYYVMELGDAQAPGWEKQPKLYKPKDLENLRKQAYERRLPPKECLRIVTVLADALNFLHSQGLIHRDIKPSNVIFVQGRPKLADVGLVANIRPPDQVHTLVGTLGYMPPRPEKPGTPQADIYALGMLLYVISTGRDPGLFPDLSTTLIERSGHAEFLPLNKIILKACQPDLDKRYQSTTEMLNDLKEIN